MKDFALNRKMSKEDTVHLEVKIDLEDKWHPAAKPQHPFF